MPDLQLLNAGVDEGVCLGAGVHPALSPWFTRAAKARYGNASEAH